VTIIPFSITSFYLFYLLLTDFFTFKFALFYSLTYSVLTFTLPLTLPLPQLLHSLHYTTLHYTALHCVSGKLREQIEDIREIKEMQKRNREKANLNLKNELNRIDLLKREEDKLKELITTFK
jgi:hypothetical protein